MKRRLRSLMVFAVAAVFLAGTPAAAGAFAGCCPSEGEGGHAHGEMHQGAAHGSGHQAGAAAVAPAPVDPAPDCGMDHVGVRSQPLSPAAETGGADPAVPMALVAVAVDRARSRTALDRAPPPGHTLPYFVIHERFLL